MLSVCRVNWPQWISYSLICILILLASFLEFFLRITNVRVHACKKRRKVFSFVCWHDYCMLMWIYFLAPKSCVRIVILIITGGPKFFLANVQFWPRFIIIFIFIFKQTLCSSPTQQCSTTHCATTLHNNKLTSFRFFVEHLECTSQAEQRCNMLPL